MRSLFLLFLLTLASLWSIAQCPETNPYCNAASNWIFGDSVWLKFQGDLIIQNNLLIGALEASSSISDSAGTLLFYANPERLFNATNFSKIVKGHNSSSQGSIILKNPYSDYYSLFTSDDLLDSDSIGLYYNNFSDIATFRSRNKLILRPSTEQLNAVNHKNNNDIWIGAHHAFNDSFYFFLLKDHGLLCCPKIEQIGPRYKNQSVIYTKGVSLKFNSIGNILSSQLFSDDKVELYHFDNEQGSLAEFLSLNFQAPWTAEFSPNGKKLYVALNLIYQYDLSLKSKMDIVNSKTALMPTWDNSIGQLQLGMDNKIYVSHFDSSFLGVIKSPKLDGTLSNYEHDGLILSTGRSSQGLPNFNASYFYTPSIDFAYTEDCWNHDYSFEGRDTLQATSWKWLFTDVRNETIEVRVGKDITYTFPQADSIENMYEVSHIASTASRSDTVTKTLTIRPKWQLNMLGNDTFYCRPFPPTGGQADSLAQDDFTLTLQAPSDMHCVHWNGEEPNLDTALGKIIDYDHFHSDTLLVDTAGTYIVKLTNKTFCQAWDTITISEYPTPSKSGISRFKDSIVSNTVAQTYRWYRDGVPQLETDDRRLKPDSNGYYQVQLVSEFGCDSELSDSLLVGFASIPSIKATNPLSFKVYPNPSDGNITIAVPKEGNYTIQIIDLNGKVVSMPVRRGGSDSPQGELYRSKNTQITINSQLASGTYILILTDENGHKGSQKIEVIQ
jgi:hypothetical protein